MYQTRHLWRVILGGWGVFTLTLRVPLMARTISVGLQSRPEAGIIGPHVPWLGNLHANVVDETNSAPADAR